MSPFAFTIRSLSLAAAALILAGCSSPSLRTTPLAFGDATGVYTNGNLRLVTERTRVQPASGRLLPTLCTEPSPDFALAFDQSGDVNATLEKLGKGDFSFRSNETTTRLDGRNAGILALRDGLYAACQSYVNGVIGHDAYALILSQYSELIIEIIHEQDATIQADATNSKRDAVSGPTPTPTPTPTAPAAATPGPKAIFDEDAIARSTGGATLTLAAVSTNQVRRTPAPSPSVAAAQAEYKQSKFAAYSALLVACLSEHDPTRIGGEDGQPKNAMLSLDYCKGFLKRALKVAKQ